MPWFMNGGTVRQQIGQLILEEWSKMLDGRKPTPLHFGLPDPPNDWLRFGFLAKALRSSTENFEAGIPGDAIRRESYTQVEAR